MVELADRGGLRLSPLPFQWATGMLTAHLAHSRDFSCPSQLPLSKPDASVTCPAVWPGTHQPPLTFRLIHSQPTCCSGLVSRHCSLWLTAPTGLAMLPGAGHTDALSPSVPHPSPSHCGVPGEQTNADIQPALSELLPALDPNPPTLSLICLQFALENDRLPSFC